MSRGPTTEDLPGSINTTGEITSVIPRPQLNEVDAAFRHRIEGESLSLQPPGRVHQAAPEHGETHVDSPVLVVFLLSTSTTDRWFVNNGTGILGNAFRRVRHRPVHGECKPLVLSFVCYFHGD